MANRKTKLKIPAYVPPTEEELARRKRVFAKIIAIRDTMEPLGFSAVDLIRADRGELGLREE
ncbi:MAG: hypothetical protein EXR52_06140 [Dehalococcoidia bacterium]|nr:hypothetical protein [Dehalococcoidia bacterium]